MTKREIKHGLLASASAAAAVALMLVLARLPPAADLIVPRRRFFWFFKAALAFRDSAAGASAASWAALFLMLGAAAIVVWRAKAAADRPGLWRGAGLAGAAALLCAAAGWALRLWLDVIQNVWSRAEGVGSGEAACAFFVAFAAALFVYASVLALARAKPLKRLAGFAAAFCLPTAGLYFWAGARYDLNAADLAAAAAIDREPSQTRTVILLTQRPGGQSDYEVRTAPLGAPGEADYSAEALEGLKRYVLKGRTVFTLRAARHLYSGHTARLEPEALREALWLAHQKGDLLGRLLLLENLAHAPINEANENRLKLLADENAYRVGARAALMLSKAFAHFDDTSAADYWSERSGRSVAKGLVKAPAPLTRGEIRGSVRGARGVRVGLFEHGDGEAPYNLGPAQLVNAQTTDAAGRFRFRGLGAGTYFLALVLEPKGAPLEKCPLGSGGRPPCLSFVSGHRGDIHLSAARPRAERDLELHLIKK